MILALDLGSRRLGTVGAPAALPLVVDRHATLPVDPADLGAVVASLAHILATFPIAGVLCEHGPLYFPKGVSDAAKLSMAKHHADASKLHERIGMLCAERGVPMLGVMVEGRAFPAISRNSWAHRVVPGHRGGVEEADANAGLERHMAPESWALLEDQDQRDAAGALVGWLLIEAAREEGERLKAERATRPRGGKRAAGAPRESAPRVPLTPEALAERKRHKAELQRGYDRARLGTSARLGGVCNCGEGGAPRPPGTKGRHRAGCAVAPPPKGAGEKSRALSFSA